jgi:hypothetical protein
MSFHALETNPNALEDKTRNTPKGKVERRVGHHSGRNGAMKVAKELLLGAGAGRARLFVSLILCFATEVNAQPPFNLDTGNAPFEVVIPTGIPVIVEDISPTASDVTLIFRVTTLVNRNTAILYASRRVLLSLLPHRAAQWDEMLESVGLDPNDDSMDPTTPAGVGNLAGLGVVLNRAHDGMNQLGNEGGCRYNCEPYADYLKYEPVNTAYKLWFPSRWQPAIVSRGNGLFHVQQFITPQMRVVTPYSYDDPDAFRAPFPWASQVWNLRDYRDQANEVLQVSANLTDEQKMTAELFDHKFNSVFSAVAFAVLSQQLTLDESVVVEFLTNMASFDTAIAVWNDKHRYDAVRPFSAIRFLYGHRHVSAWGGPGKGTVHDLPGKQWTSYLNVANHPEYPSASASFCAAHAQVMRRLLGSDSLGFTVNVPAGSSVVEPGVTPAADLSLSWATWTDLENDCGQSRLWGGVHFSASIPAGMQIGHQIADLAYEFVERHLDGNVD